MHLQRVSNKAIFQGSTTLWVLSNNAYIVIACFGREIKDFRRFTYSWELFCRRCTGKHLSFCLNKNLCNYSTLWDSSLYITLIALQGILFIMLSERGKQQNLKPKPLDCILQTNRFVYPFSIKHHDSRQFNYVWVHILWFNVVAIQT